MRYRATTRGGGIDCRSCRRGQFNHLEIDPHSVNNFQKPSGASTQFIDHIILPFRRSIRAKRTALSRLIIFNLAVTRLKIKDKRHDGDSATETSLTCSLVRPNIGGVWT